MEKAITNCASQLRTSHDSGAWKEAMARARQCQKQGQSKDTRFWTSVAFRLVEVDAISSGRFAD